MTTILVTGASRGIGRGIALELARSGHRVAIHYNRNRDAALQTAVDCRALNHDGDLTPDDDLFQADLSSSAERERLVDEVFSRYGDLDGLVNNAGMAPRQRADLLSASEESFEEVLGVNLRGPYFLTQLVARHWVEASGGLPAAGARPHASSRAAADVASSSAPAADEPAAAKRIVFVTSVSADMASPERGEYCVSKAALSMAARLFATRLAPEGILVFEVRPGIIATDMTSGVKEKYDARIGAGLVPQGRWGEPGDIGKAVAGIMAGTLDFSAGSVITSDGGLHLPRL